MADKCCGSNKKTLKTVETKHDVCCNPSATTEIEPKNNSCCSHTAEKKPANLIETSHNCSSEASVDASASSCCGTEKGASRVKSNDGNDFDSETKVNKHPPVTGKKSEFYINGMDCPSCALTIEKGLGRLNDIQEAKVIYNTAKLQVVGSNALSLDTVEKEVQRLGFTVEPLEQHSNVKTYHVEGMDCGSCAKSIENHLNRVPTIHHVDVNFSTGKMKVDDENNNIDIISEVAKLGFKAYPTTQGNKSVETSKSKVNYGSITLSGTFIAVGFIGSYSGLPYLVSTLLYALALIISGYKPIKSAYFSIKSRSLDM